MERQLVRAATQTAQLLTDDVYGYTSTGVGTSILNEERDSLTHSKDEVRNAWTTHLACANQFWDGVGIDQVSNTLTGGCISVMTRGLK